MTPVAFAALLIDYCQAMRGSVTSWGRTLAHNRAVGGDARSLHLTWRAADVVYDTMPDRAAAQDAARRRELYVHREGDHDHIRPAEDVWA
jgi:hypothetical protein